MKKLEKELLSKLVTSSVFTKRGLGRTFPGTKANVFAALERLQSEGLVTRKKVGYDRSEWKLTAKGAAAQKEIVKKQDDKLRKELSASFGYEICGYIINDAHAGQLFCTLEKEHKHEAHVALP
jgi:predicted transcriptional regulator